jgi:short-subunit dehydrogenase
LLANEAGTLILVARRLEKQNKIKEKILKDNLPCTVTVFDKDISIRQNQIDMLESLKQDHIEIDILINNAGMGDEGFFHQSNWEKMEQIIDLNILI